MGWASFYVNLDWEKGAKIESGLDVGSEVANQWSILGSFSQFS
jgi:hypothetical protein